MIIKGKPSSSAKFWAKYLLAEGPNDRAELIEIKGLVAEDVPTALKIMKAIADQSRSHGKFLYQANINPRAGEHLTPEQWAEAVDTLEKNLGLEGHQRIVVEHEKFGRVHRHVVWNRVDSETLRVADMGGNYYAHERAARELEKRFGLKPAAETRDKQKEQGQSDQPDGSKEQEKPRFKKRDPEEVKKEMTELWNAAGNGKEFRAALEERGYTLAKGDRRDYCVVERSGFVHNLARRIDGVRAKDVRQKLADIDRDSLPAVDDVQYERGWDRGNRRKAMNELRQANGRDDKALRNRENKKFSDKVTKRLNEKIKRNAEFEAKAHDGWKKRAKAQRARANKLIQPAKGAIYVGDRLAGGVVTLLDFVGGLLDDKSRAPMTPEQMRLSEQIVAERRAEAALENIRESMERGENLRPSDLTRLTDSHLENIRLQGDDYMRELVASIQKSRERDSDWGRTRER